LRTKEEGEVSEKSARDDFDNVGETRTARNRSGFRLQMQPWPCDSTRKRYNSDKSVPKKEIPVNIHCRGVYGVSAGGPGVRHPARQSRRSIEPHGSFAIRVTQSVFRAFAEELLDLLAKTGVVEGAPQRRPLKVGQLVLALVIDDGDFPRGKVLRRRFLAD